jgi:radical SAM superfamily enzyme YgiQ (UPF0313 family)
MILEKGTVDRYLLEYRPDVLAVTGYITHVSIIKEYCAAAKRLLSGCRTIVGGVHAEVVPEDFVDAAVDHVVCANGITTFREVINALACGRDASALPGVWRKDGVRPAKETSFDHPFPDRSKVAKYRARYYYLFHNPCALIKTSFGCPFSCEFCFCREITAGQYYERSVESVIQELKGISERDIYVVDDNFLVSRERVLAFCRKLGEERLDKKFLIYGRADFIAKNPDVIAEFKQRGLRAVIVGVESCVEGDLEKYNKKNDVACNEAAVRILAEHGVDCYATLILGMEWREEDFKRLGRWLRKMDLAFVNLQPFTPLPGTAMFESHGSKLIVPRTDYEKWDLAHLVLQPSGMSPARYYWNIIKLYYAVTMRLRNIVRLLFRHGLRENLKMLAGSTRVTMQYLQKVEKSWSRNET